MPWKYGLFSRDPLQGDSTLDRAEVTLESMANNVFKNIPSVNELLETPALKGLVDKVSHNVVAKEVRSFLDDLRQEVAAKADALDLRFPSTSEMAETIAQWVARGEKTKLQPIVNATGILLHTGLGRAPMAEQAVSAVATIAQSYASLEVDLESGQRSQRNQVVGKLLAELTGAESAAVVNNNAGATLLTLSALASGKEVIVSRGELIEIGGSYRLPDVMAAGGAILREVGTTNKTRADDYQAACGENTAALMRVHTSNYRVVGFSEAASLPELVSVAKTHRTLLIDDIGSGALFDFSVYGVEDEPIASESIAAGADVVLFSGDKLLGGPQCGIILGKTRYIDRIVKHPLMRALRVDKMTLAALTATLQLHRDRKKAEASIPLLRLLATSVDNLRNRAERLSPQIAACTAINAAQAIESSAQLGGGSVPARSIPSWAIAITPDKVSVDAMARQLRTGTPSVFGRVHKGQLLLDLRTVLPSQDASILDAIQKLESQNG